MSEFSGGDLRLIQSSSLVFFKLLCIPASLSGRVDVDIVVLLSDSV